MARSVRAASAGTRIPAAACGCRSRTRRWARRSRVVQPAQSVGRSGPTRSSSSLSAARSRLARLMIRAYPLHDASGVLLHARFDLDRHGKPLLRFTPTAAQPVADGSKEIVMAPARYTRRTALAGAGAALVLALAACGGNLGSSGAGGEQAAESFPTGPINLAVGQDPGGSTDLIARALADRVSDDLGVPVPVVNTPGANGALAAKELAGKAPDGQNLMVFNASLAAITPLAVPADQAVDIADFEVVTGISQDDFILVANPATGFRTVQDIVNAGRPITYGTTGVGTGSQLSQALLFAQAGIEANAVPFDGASPAMTALLGG